MTAENMTPEEALGVVDSLVARARPGEQLEAALGFTHSTEVRAHGGELEHFVSASEIGITVRIVHEGRTGLSWAGAPDQEILDECVDEARDNARFSSPDPHAGLGEPDGVGFADLDVCDRALVDVDPAEKVRFVRNLDAGINAADPRIIGHEGADYSDSSTVSAVASTTGIRAVEHETTADAGVFALASDGGEVSTGFGLTFGRGFAALDAEEVIGEAVARATAMLGARKARSDRLTVVMDPYVTSQFLGVVAAMFSGESVVRRRTPFSERMGEAIASPLLTLRDDPHDPESTTSGAVDGEGLATRPVALVESGLLTSFLHNSYTARSMGTASTGSAVRTGYRSAPRVGTFQLTPVPGATAPGDVVGAIDNGLLVREVSGLHSGMNPVSGDVSIGAEGFMIRRGELAEPVREVTIGSTVQRMLANVAAVGSDLRRFPWDSAGVTLAVADVTMSGS